MSANPFHESAFHIRWSALTPELIVPAVDEAVERARLAVAAISSQAKEGLTYDNTFLALERATEELTMVWAKVTHLQSVADSPPLREAHNAVLPRVSAFYAGIPLNPELWARLRVFAATPAAAALAGINRRFLDETMADFRQAGADLPEEKRLRLEALQTELAQLTQKYSENVLDATNAWQLVVTDESRLDGLPILAKAAARRGAESKGTDGWRFTLHMPSLEPFMTYIRDESLRREMWTASTAIGAGAERDNAPLIERILSLRAEKATLLGKAHFADLVLERRMAKNGNRALDFVSEMETRAQAAFFRECGELELFKAEQVGLPSARLAPWEILFWAEKLRRERHAFDEEALRPYFPMNQVIAGMFELVGRVFGLRVTERPVGQVEVWHPEVKFYDVYDRGSRHLGSFYADWYPRESKRGGAWMNYLVTGGPQPDGSRAPHLGLMCGNMTPPNEGRAALLTHREVETVFHEFGHLLHHLLGEVAIKSLNGVNVAWDFVELPSQLMENWTWERESLDLFARHVETGATIPEEMYRKMIGARNFRSACVTMRQVAFAKMDLLMHMKTEEFSGGADVEARAHAAVENCLIPTEPSAPTIVKRFTHIFSDPTGYAAGYYSYKWAEVLDADAFTRFQCEGIFCPKVGGEFVEKILSKGNSCDPADLFRSFMGRDPNPQALLKRAGLATT